MFYSVVFVSAISQFSSVQSLSHVRLFATPWTAASQASLSITNSWSLLKPMPIELVMPSSHLTLCRPLLLLPSIFPSIRVFSNESALRMRWLKYWSFSFNISPSNEHQGLISFRKDWLDLLAVQGTLGFCHTTPQISHNYTWTTSLASHQRAPLGRHRAAGWARCVRVTAASQQPSSSQVTLCAHVRAALSVRPLPSSPLCPCVHSLSESLLLHCKEVLRYHCS